MNWNAHSVNYLKRVMMLVLNIQQYPKSLINLEATLEILFLHLTHFPYIRFVCFCRNLNDRFYLFLQQLQCVIFQYEMIVMKYQFTD